MKIHLSILIVGIFAILSGCNNAEVLPDIDNVAAESVTQAVLLPEGVSVHQLDNGLQIILIENHALPMIGSNVVVKVGSAYENFSTSGMSHMLEHLLFNGTSTRTQKQLYDDFDRIGAFNNANTGFYGTNYMVVTPSKYIDQGLELQADMLFNSILPKKKYEKEKGIVLEEIAIAVNKPASQLDRNARSILYPGHAVSLPTLGTYETIKTNELATVKAYYKNFYVPNNMVMSVIGDFDSASMLKTIERIFGAAKPGQVRVENDQNWAVGFQSIDRSQQDFDQPHQRFYNGDKTHIQLFYPLGSDSNAYFSLLNEASKSVRETLLDRLQTAFPGAVQSLSISTWPSPVQPWLQFDVVLADESKGQAVNDWLQRAIPTSRFSITKTQAEAQATKQMLSFFINLEKPHMFGIMHGEEFSIAGIDGVMASFIKQDLSGVIDAVNTTVLQKPLLLVQRPAPQKTEQQVDFSNVVSLQIDADTGLQLTVQRNPTGKILAVHVMMGHKSGLESEYGADLSWLLHDMLGRHLKKVFSQGEAAQYGFKFVANDLAFIPMDDIYLHRDFGYLRAEGIASDVPKALQRLASEIQGFTPTEASFKRALQGLKMDRRMRTAEPAKTLFEETYKTAVYQPRIYTPKKGEVSYAALLAFRDSYMSLGNVIYSVVSPASDNDVLAAMKSGVSSSQTKFGKDLQVDELRLKIPSAPINIELNGGGKQSYLFWGFVKKIKAADQAPLQVLSLMMRDQIVFDVREKQGLAYRMGAGVEIRGEQALFFLNMGTRPENISTLIPQLKTIYSVEYLKNIDQANLERLVNKYLGQMAFRRLSSINQSYYAGNSVYFQDDIHYDARQLEAIAAVKLTDVQRVAKTFLQIENPIQVVVK